MALRECIFAFVDYTDRGPIRPPLKFTTVLELSKNSGTFTFQPELRAGFLRIGTT